ncbi:MAG: RecQ family zinc-binding domain-containing protein, partial [Firmicutes bacterium]|nr:RecQ family zinc-binding domain-containing protein [Bacillota bacterium]
GAIDLGSRVDRIIRYRSLKSAGRRAYKYQRLDKLVSYLENTTKCRARWISEYFGKPMNDCVRCDVCSTR